MLLSQWIELLCQWQSDTHQIIAHFSFSLVDCALRRIERWLSGLNGAHSGASKHEIIIIVHRGGSRLNFGITCIGNNGRIKKLKCAPAREIIHHASAENT
jgi:hypothetical protein